MDTFITVFKFLGIIVSGVLGILGTATQTRNETTGELNTWGKWALGLTIVGFTVALGAQFLESRQQKYEAERTNSVFKSISLDASFEISLNGHSSLQSLVNEMTNVAFTILKAEPQRLTLPFPRTNQAVGIVLITKGLSGFFAESNTIVALQMRVGNADLTNSDPRLLPIYSALYRSQIQYRLGVPNLSISRSRSSSFEFRIPGNTILPPLKGDLILPAQFNFGTLMTYDCITKTLRFTFSEKYQLDNVHGNKAVISIRDLNKAVGRIYLDDSAEYQPSEMRPLEKILSDVKLAYLNLCFDDLNCSFSRVNGKSPDGTREEFEFSFPSYSQIMSGQADHQQPPVEIFPGWSF